MRPHPVSLLLLSVSLVVPGCGGDADGDRSVAPRPSAEPAASRPAEPTQAVTMSGREFRPSNVTAVADSAVAIRNAGGTGHDLKLRREGKEVGGTPILNPGQVLTLELRYPPGRYEMYCSVPGHEESGMRGTFTVE